MSKFGFLFLFFISSYGFAQITDPDKAYADARELAFKGRKSDAEELLKKILIKYPNYLEIRAFLGKVYSWNNKYELSREQYQILIGKDSTNKDGWEGYVQNELYDNKPLKAEELAYAGLSKIPNNIELSIMLGKALKDQYKLQEAYQVIQNAKDYHGKNKKLSDFQETIRDKLAFNEFSINYGQDYFTKIYGQMYYLSLQYGRQAKYGSFTAKYNLNEKFNRIGSQIEIDAYPSLGKGRYAFLNFGYSASSIFPKLRYGAQVYQTLPRSFEASLGFRTLVFSRRINIYTGTVGKYFGSSFLMFTPYLTNGDEGWSRSGNLAYRRYGANEDIFWSIYGGLGFSPDINRFGDDVATQGIINLKAQKIGYTNNFRIKNNRNIVSTNISAIRQENFLNPGSYYFIYSFGLGYSLRTR